MTDEVKPPEVQTSAPISPTGQPMLSAKLAPYLFVLVTLCAALGTGSKLKLGLPPEVFDWSIIGGLFFGGLLAATPGFRKAVPVVLLFLSLGLSSCSHAQAYVATGESVDALGQAYLATSKAMEVALDAHQVTPAQYRKWSAFAEYFRPLYDFACDRFLHYDESAQLHAAAVLAELSAELAEWSALIALPPPHAYELPGVPGFVLARGGAL